jgi:hypothetical protein
MFMKLLAIQSSDYTALSGRRLVVNVTRRVAAGWLVLPFQGGRKY